MNAVDNALSLLHGLRGRLVAAAVEDGASVDQAEVAEELAVVINGLVKFRLRLYGPFPKPKEVPE